MARLCRAAARPAAEQGLARVECFVADLMLRRGVLSTCAPLLKTETP